MIAFCGIFSRHVFVAFTRLDAINFTCDLKDDLAIGPKKVIDGFARWTVKVLLGEFVVVRSMTPWVENFAKNRRKCYGFFSSRTHKNFYPDSLINFCQSVNNSRVKNECVWPNLYSCMKSLFLQQILGMDERKWFDSFCDWISLRSNTSFCLSDNEQRKSVPAILKFPQRLVHASSI